MSNDGIDRRPLVMHLVYRFDIGGLENGMVNLINRLPEDSFRHVVVALTEVVPDFARRIHRKDVEYLSLHKAPGHGIKLYLRLLMLFRRWRPAIVHTRNLAALEMQVPAWLARVPVRIHGEHGRDVSDLDGTSLRYQRLRRLYAPFVGRYVALSQDLAGYLSGPVGITAARIDQIYNGVDTSRFTPAATGPAPIAGCPFVAPAHWLVGTVGRMQTVKNQTLLARAFARALAIEPALHDRARLVLVGDGPLRAQVQAMLGESGLADLAWLPGERDDVADVMRGLNCFVLPSLAEGISNTILEAMATGLPVIATDVGGNAELVEHQRTGCIVPSSDEEAMAHALVRMYKDPLGSAAMAAAARGEVLRRFSLESMVSAYQDLYDRQLAAAGYTRQFH